MNLALSQTSAEVSDFLGLKRQRLDEEFEDDFKEQDYQRIDANEEMENIEELESNAFEYYRRQPLDNDSLEDISKSPFPLLTSNELHFIPWLCLLVHLEVTELPCFLWCFHASQLIISVSLVYLVFPGF